MTTTVKVHVNGQYRATVKQDDREPVTIEGNYNGGSGEKSFYLPHPAKATFEISEEPVADDDKRAFAARYGTCLGAISAYEMRIQADCVGLRK